MQRCFYVGTQFATCKLVTKRIHPQTEQGCAEVVTMENKIHLQDAEEALMRAFTKLADAREYIMTPELRSMIKSAQAEVSSALADLREIES